MLRTLTFKYLVFLKQCVFFFKEKPFYETPIKKKDGIQAEKRPMANLFGHPLDLGTPPGNQRMDLETPDLCSHLFSIPKPSRLSCSFLGASVLGIIS